MKKTILAIACCLVTIGAAAHVETYNVYYDHVTKTRGELYLYAERYLGTTDVIMADTSYYELSTIKQVIDTASSKSGFKSTWKPNTQTVVKTQLPLSEETLMATNLAKKAESVAKQIYRIRETRMNILAGDVEHAPADGKAMQQVLEELDKQEKALTSMFVGTTVIKNSRKTYDIDLSDSEKAIKKTICKFDSQKGLLGAQNENGYPVTIQVTRLSKPVPVPNAKKGEPTMMEVFYQSATRIVCNNRLMYEKVIDL